MQITFTRRQVALMLRIVMRGEQLERLATITSTAAADLRLIAGGQKAPTSGVLSCLDLRQIGREEYAWDVQ